MDQRISHFKHSLYNTGKPVKKPKTNSHQIFLLPMFNTTPLYIWRKDRTRYCGLPDKWGNETKYPSKEEGKFQIWQCNVSIMKINGAKRVTPWGYSIRMGPKANDTHHGGAARGKLNKMPIWIDTLPMSSKLISINTDASQAQHQPQHWVKNNPT